MEDGDDNGHSINDDLRMIGESGDNHDGGGDLGVHELFVSTAATPIELAVGDVPGDGGGAGAVAAAANNVPQSRGIPKPRRTTSPAWEDIDPIYTNIGGKTVRTGAICKWCKSNLSAGSGGGTGHLLRHVRDCKVKAAVQGKQSQLKFNPDGSDWLLEKKVIGLRLIEVSHNADNIAERVLSVIADWGCTDKFDDDFNLLNWWHEHKLTYLVLSILARDVISVRVSTISSESAFSLCGRIIEERRRRLSSEMVEMLLCIKK
ncbi:hypothetical protein U9M48_033312 [Paspalum notatum var. saurae]|uniref:HAT C-terminal dimerisation domain-containing protein n=1 Tax=Paspalum notatum var. saurae TaxID=547442 RepID=A0AAQ3U753_PASNO